jgi:hypothetical protein
MYDEDDPEVVLQNALRALQQEEQAAEEHAAAVREERDHQERMAMEQHHHAMDTTPSRDPDEPRYTTEGHDMNPELTLTPIHAEVSMTGGERPLRCPFCVNQRMLRSIKEAVEHLSTHVVV